MNYLCTFYIPLSWTKMKDTIFIENFMFFYFDKQYFHVKINTYGHIAKIQIFSMVFRLWIAAHIRGRGGEF